MTIKIRPISHHVPIKFDRLVVHRDGSISFTPKDTTLTIKIRADLEANALRRSKTYRDGGDTVYEDGEIEVSRYTYIAEIKPQMERT